MSGEPIVVIGSGPAGAAAARALIRDGLPVTMLESGTSDPRGLLVRAAGRNLLRRGPEAVSDPEAFVPAGHPRTRWFQHLQPGGLSNQWTGAVPRFAPGDFCDGARLHPRYRWPLTYDDLAPYYDEIEPVLQITASRRDVRGLPAGRACYERSLPRRWLDVAAVAARHGQGLTALPLADGPTWLITRRGTAFNSYSTIVKQLRRSPRFELVTGAHALHLEWSGERQRVTAVVYHDLTSGQHRRIEGAAVVVACGALASTKLLLDSACSDFPEGLGNTEGLLGRYLHDHPKEWWTFTSERALPRLAPAAYLTRRPYEVSEPLLATSWTLGNATARDKVLSLTPLKTTVLGVQVFGSMVPTADNHVRLSPQEKDEFGLPRLEVQIDFDDATRQNVEGARAQLMATMAEAGYRCHVNPVVPQLVPGVAVHYGGTVRMHRCREHGVLNEWNRPFDIPNLVVSDASCFTTNSEKNPTLTAMAISTRAAHRLGHDLRRA